MACPRLSPVALAFAAALAFSAPAVAQQTLSEWQRGILVSLDHALVLKLPAGVATLVIGNPLIADATVQQGGVMVVTGKSYGQTNLIALDRNGTQVGVTQVRVNAPSGGLVRVFRGVERETYTCAPNCERSVMVGDTDQFFNTTMTQGNSRVQQGAAAAPPIPAPAVPAAPR